MRTDWLRNVKDEDKESFKKRLNAAGKIFDKEEEILQSWLESEFNDSIGDEDFGSPNWAAHQAYRKGKMRAYKEVISLIKDLTSK